MILGFTVNYTSSDSESGIVGCYWGTSVPTASSNWTEWSGGNITKNINVTYEQNVTRTGIYYFGVKDACGNINYTVFKWLACWYDEKHEINTSGYNYYNCGWNDWHTLYICGGSLNGTLIAEFTANSGSSGSLQGYSNVWVKWEKFNFACWN